MEVMLIVLIIYGKMRKRKRGEEGNQLSGNMTVELKALRNMKIYGKGQDKNGRVWGGVESN